MGSQEGLLEDAGVEPAVFYDKPGPPTGTKNFNHINLLTLSPLSGDLLDRILYEVVHSWVLVLEKSVGRESKENAFWKVGWVTG